MDRQALIDGLSDAILIADSRLRVRLINDRARALLGLAVAFSAVGRSLRHVLRAANELPSHGAEEVVGICRACVEAERRETRHARAGGFAIAVEPVGSGLWRLTFAFDLRSGESSDALTGLADRSAFHDRLQQAIAQRSEGATGPCMLMLDLDRFKHVNDTLGHPVGDSLLRAVADRLRASVRTRDLVARLGGDEFAILLPDCVSADDIAQLAARLVDIIGRPYLVAGHLASVGVSIGVAFADDDARDADTLVRHADLALYQAKHDGRGTWRVFAAHMHERAQARRTLEADLRRALALRQFVLHYQPQLSLRSRRLTGFEALLRWQHPEQGMISPENFIPLAEETGLIEAIGAWVLRTACVEATHWPCELRVAVNVSPVQFGRADMLLTAVQEALDGSGLPGNRLEIEITESALLGAEQATLALLRALRSLGVRIAMDDFGTGYSSLSQLRSFPFEKIKIDRSFVRDIGSDQQAASIIRSINALGASLGMSTIAEGVETEAQARSLLEGGCGDIQGYFISRPIPSEEVRALISHLGNKRETRT